MRWLVCAALLLPACESESSTAPSAQPWVPEALTREHPIASMLPSSSASLPPPGLGAITLESKSLGWPAGSKLEIGAAFAHLLEEWPTPRGGLPRLVIDRVELYAKGVTGMSCSTSGNAAPGGVLPTAIVLEGKHKVEVEWEKDFAIGDDFDLCVIGAAAADKPGSVQSCPGLGLGRANVILSISRDRIRGRLNVQSGRATVTGRFDALVCPLPPLE